MKTSILIRNEVYKAGIVNEGNYATISMPGHPSILRDIDVIAFDGYNWKVISCTESPYVKRYFNARLEKINDR